MYRLHVRGLDDSERHFTTVANLEPLELTWESPDARTRIVHSRVPSPPRPACHARVKGEATGSRSRVLRFAIAESSSVNDMSVVTTAASPPGQQTAWSP